VICPKCRAEYVSGVTACYDCGTDLVDVLPPKPTVSHPAPELGGVPAEPFSLVTVFATSDAGLMGIAQTILESARIPVVVEGEYETLFGPGLVSTFHPRALVSLRVAPQDVHDARALLAELIVDGGSHHVAHS
jgi:hypothetical protein